MHAECRIGRGKRREKRWGGVFMRAEGKVEET